MKEKHRKAFGGLLDIHLPDLMHTSFGFELFNQDTLFVCKQTEKLTYMLNKDAIKKKREKVYMFPNFLTISPSHIKVIS